MARGGSQDSDGNHSAGEGPSGLSWGCRFVGECGDPGGEWHRGGGGRTLAETAGTASGYQGESGSEPGADGDQCRLPQPEQRLELRAGIEHDGSHGEPHAHFPLEEAGVAASCQAGNRGGEGPPLEAQPEVAEPPSGPGSRGVVGPLRGDEAEAEQSRGVAPDVRVQRPNRGLGQRLKAGAHQGPTHAAMIQATFRDSGRWRLVEVFTGDPLFMRY